MEQAFSESASGAMRSTGVGAGQAVGCGVQGEGPVLLRRSRWGRPRGRVEGGSQAGGQPCFQEAQVMFAELHSCDCSGLILAGSSQGPLETAHRWWRVCVTTLRGAGFELLETVKFRGHFSFCWLPVVNVI